MLAVRRKVWIFINAGFGQQRFLLEAALPDASIHCSVVIAGAPPLALR